MSGTYIQSPTNTEVDKGVPVPVGIPALYRS